MGKREEKELSDVEDALEDLKVFFRKINRKAKKDWTRLLIRNTKKQIDYLEKRKDRLGKKLDKLKKQKITRKK